jgi:hypothetical protein
MDSEIIIVSGLPRCGTSLMMQMLENGGVEVLTDQARPSDPDNPRGYYEFAKVKQIKQDTSWLPQARGKAFKMVSQLLYDLPPNERYRIIFMERDMEEMLLSQEKMLQRLGRSAAPRQEIQPAYSLHLERLHHWLRKQSNMEVLSVRYHDLVEQPHVQAERVCQFLGGKGKVEHMATQVEPSLYRNRRTGIGPPV